MGITRKNLKEAFAGESKACIRLLAYAEQADREGLPHLASLFQAISEAERIHAFNHLRLLDEVEDTQTNLKKSFERELSISENIYPEMIRLAFEEGQKSAGQSFTYARDAESFHAKLYKNALEHMLADRESTYRVCRVCGWVTDGETPSECPICGAKRAAFFRVP